MIRERRLCRTQQTRRIRFLQMRDTEHKYRRNNVPGRPSTRAINKIVRRRLVAISEIKFPSRYSRLGSVTLRTAAEHMRRAPGDPKCETIFEHKKRFGPTVRGRVRVTSFSRNVHRTNNFRRPLSTRLSYTQHVSPKKRRTAAARSKIDTTENERKAADARNPENSLGRLGFRCISSMVRQVRRLRPSARAHAAVGRKRVYPRATGADGHRMTNVRKRSKSRTLVYTPRLRERARNDRRYLFVRDISSGERFVVRAYRSTRCWQRRRSGDAFSRMFRRRCPACVVYGRSSRHGRLITAAGRT